MLNNYSRELVKVFLICIQNHNAICFFSKTINFFIEGPRSRCYGLTAALMLIVQPYDEDDEVFLLLHFNGAQVELMKLTEENRSTRRKTCPSAILSATNPTWTDLGSNQNHIIRTSGHKLSEWTVKCIGHNESCFSKSS